MIRRHYRPLETSSMAKEMGMLVEISSQAWVLENLIRKITKNKLNREC